MLILFLQLDLETKIHIFLPIISLKSGIFQTTFKGKGHGSVKRGFCPSKQSLYSSLTSYVSFPGKLYGPQLQLFIIFYCSFSWGLIYNIWIFWHSFFPFPKYPALHPLILVVNFVPSHYYIGNNPRFGQLVLFGDL